MGGSYSTLGGYTVLFGLAAGLAFLEYRRRPSHAAKAKQQQRLRPDRQQPAAKKENKEAKPRRQRIEDTQQESYASKLKSQAPAQSHQPAYSSDEDDADNREFARQLSNVKQGTKFTAKSKEETRQKSVKQSQAQEIHEPADGAKASAPSSTAGIDADDDQSSAASPSLGAVEAGGVSDMLDKPAPGPSVLRLTDTEEKKPLREKKQKTPEPVESKKQRQNRKKAEAAKAEREAAEKERQVKLEAQRRLARQSEGRPAKDGSAFVAAQAATNAWAGNSNGIGGKTNGQSGTNGFLPVQPLDTAEPKAAPTGKPKSSSSFNKAEDWMTSLPSEEEQMEMLRKEEEEWNTVTAKPRKSKKKDGAAENQDENTTPPEPAAVPAAAAPPAKKPQPVTSGASKTKPAFKQQSSFAALSTDTGAADNEEEEEWDV